MPARFFQQDLTQYVTFVPYCGLPRSPGQNHLPEGPESGRLS